MRRRRSLLALAQLALLALSCGARTDLREPREIALERTERRLVFALDYSLTGFAHTANEPTISSWQSAIRMTETVASAMDSSVLVGGLVYPHPLGPQNVSCRIDDSMLTVPTAGAEAFVRLARSFTPAARRVRDVRRPAANRPPRRVRRRAVGGGAVRGWRSPLSPRVRSRGVPMPERYGRLHVDEPRRPSRLAVGLRRHRASRFGDHHAARSRGQSLRRRRPQIARTHDRL